jgi:uncharacterized iron-regulated membrane protein
MTKETLTSIQFSFSQKLYRTIWRWHFYAGLFCIPFILTLAVSGTIFLFKPQIENFIDRQYHQLETGSRRSTPDQQIEAALAAVPGSVFLNYTLPVDDHSAVVIGVNRNGERVNAYVNPYTSEVMKTVVFDNQFIQLVRTFHGELLAGNIGSVIIELAGTWAIVMIISGLYLWWPRQITGPGGILYPRLYLQGRMFWRDLHAVFGLWVSVFTLFLLISGLPWALVWGSAFKEIRNLGNETAVVQDWTAGRAEEQAALDDHSHHNMADMPESATYHLNSSVVATAQELDFAPPAILTFDNTNAGQWTLNSDHQNRMLRNMATLTSEGEVTSLTGFDDQPLLDRVIGIGISAHEGHLFGWMNQLLGLFTTVSLFLISISGFILWRKRKPEGKLGAPVSIPNSSAGKAVTVIVLGMAMFLPLLALSLVMLLVLEWGILRHLSTTRRWLGLA